MPKDAGDDPLQFAVPLQQDDDAGDESYSIPLSMRRPRSDSDSRYLTDSVRYSTIDQFHSISDIIEQNCEKWLLLRIFFIELSTDVVCAGNT